MRGAFGLRGATRAGKGRKCLMILATMHESKLRDLLDASRKG